MWAEAKECIIDSSASSSVYIGCDSIRFKKLGKWYAKYTTVVVVHKDTRHGCRIFYNDVVLPDYGILKQRLMTECQFAADALGEIEPLLGGRYIEVHLDLNNDPKHKSNIAVKEALGWIRGLGVVAKIKPESWAATHAADHCVRSKTFAHG
jgi:predicted RNase H-related nuclease YkuK (DUF458 family)